MMHYEVGAQRCLRLTGYRRPRERQIMANHRPSSPPHHQPRKPRPQPFHLPGRQGPGCRVRRAAFLHGPVRHARIGQRVQGKQIIHTEQARVPSGAAFIGHPAGRAGGAPCRSRRAHGR